MPLTPEEETFLKEHRLAVLATVRKDGGPQATPVYYLYDSGKLYISATRPRQKTINIERDSRVAVTVLAEEMPFKHVQIFGTAVVSDDNLVEMSKRVWRTFRNPLPDDFEQRLIDQQRTLLVVTPESATTNL